MPKGGARINSGPPPDPNALRRDRGTGLDKDGWLTLPADGYSGPVPGWPLLPDIGLRANLTVVERQIETLEYQLEEATGSKAGQIEVRLDRAREKREVLAFQVAEQESRERALWGELWRSAQAAAWHAKVGSGGVRDVAQYVRHKVLAELGSMEDAREARQWSDRLGLNPAAMLRNRWRVAADQVGDRRAEKTQQPVPVPAGRSSRDRLKAVQA